MWEITEKDQKEKWAKADLEKAASGASGACGHFVENPIILRTFRVGNPVFLTEDGGRRLEDKNWGWVKENWDWRKRMGE